MSDSADGHRGQSVHTSIGSDGRVMDIGSCYFEPLQYSTRSKGISPAPISSWPSTPEEAPLLVSRSSDAQYSASHDSGSRSDKQRSSRNHRVRPYHSKTWLSGVLGALLVALLSVFLVSAGPLFTKLLWQGLAKNEYCVNAINFAYNPFTFAGARETYWENVCREPLRVTSMLAAAKTYCVPKDIMPGFAAVRRDCLAHAGLDLLDLETISVNLTRGYISTLQVVDADESSPVGGFILPVLISPAYVQKVYKTIRIWHYEVGTHHAYGFALYAYWIIVVLFGMISNLWITFAARKRATASPNLGTGHFRYPNRFTAVNTGFSIVHWFRTHIFIPAAIGTHHQKLYYWCTIPTRLDTLIISAFWLLAIVLSSISYLPYPENFFWADNTSYQLGRYISDRTGVMSYASLSLIWIFAARNSGFLWATGWSYRTFNIYHRHVARVGTLLGIVHSFGYTYLYVSTSGWAGYAEAVKQNYLIYGIMATVSMSALLILSHAWIRVKLYETFLLLHILLSVMTLVGLFTHTYSFENSQQYLWPPLIIWIGDRCLRMIRLLYSNYQAVSSRHIFEATESTASYDEKADVIRLEILPGFMRSLPFPGSYYQIYQAGTVRGYESHPFTVGAWSITDPAVDMNARNENAMDQASESLERLDTDVSDSRHLLTSASDSPSTTLIFWVRPYDGWTRRLRDDCLRSATGIIKPRLLLEGPYGHAAPLHSYDTVLLIAGGTGIAAAVPYILQHGVLSQGRSSRTTSIHLVWTTRQIAFIESLCRNELAPFLGRQDMKTSFYSTRIAGALMLDDHAGSRLSEQGRADLDMLKISHSRPDVRSIVLATARENPAGRTAVMVCGPAGMADGARATVHEAMRNGSQNLDYFEEAFG